MDAGHPGGKQGQVYKWRRKSKAVPGAAAVVDKAHGAVDPMAGAEAVPVVACSRLTSRKCCAVRKSA